MLGIQLAFLFAALTACVFGPGFLFVRRLRWDPLETITASIAFSLIIVYVLVFGAFVLDLPVWSSYVITAFCSGLTLAGVRDARRLFQLARARRVVLVFALLFLWMFGLQALIRQYGGGEWCCDWLEHYQRSVHFVTRGPVDFHFIGRYLLPARPPMMNVLAAHFLAQVGVEFPVYQVVATFFNALLFFPCCLLARLFARHGGRQIALIAILLGFNPMFFMNTTFPWTKALTAFFVMTAVWFYVVAWRRGDRWRMPAAFVALAAGVLVHYSAAPYGLFFTLHYLAVVVPGRSRRVLEMLVIGGACVLLLGTWFAWSTKVYGADTYVGNTMVEGVAQLSPVENLKKILSNMADTFRPRIFPGLEGDTPFRRFSDIVFMNYQNTVPAALGSVGGVVLIWLLVRGLGWPRGALAEPERRFWILFILFNVVVGIAANGDIREHSIAHLCLQPLVYTGIAMLAANLPGRSRAVRRAVWLGLLADAGLGLGLAVYFERADEAWAWTPNWDLKRDHGLTFLADQLGRADVVLGAVLIGVAVLAWLWSARLLDIAGPRA